VANVRNSGAVFGIRLPNSGALSVLIILVHIPICQLMVLGLAMVPYQPIAAAIAAAISAVLSQVSPWAEGGSSTCSQGLLHSPPAAGTIESYGSLVSQ
jgi:hypothetical protein